MQIIQPSKACFLAIFLTAALASTAIRAAGQSDRNRERVSPSGSLQGSQPAVSGDQIFAGLVKHNETRATALREYSAARTYIVTDLNGKIQAQETVRMDYAAPDEKKFVTIAEEGSVAIRHLALNRLMENEVSAAAGQDLQDSSLSPANYAFRVLGEEDLGDHHCFLVEALPKRQDKYLFEGRIWIDSDEFAVVKIVGHPAKTPSFWITRADFVREYEKIGGFWLPAKDEILVDVRTYGKRILSIKYHVDSVNGVGVMSTALAAQQTSRGFLGHGP